VVTVTDLLRKPLKNEIGTDTDGIKKRESVKLETRSGVNKKKVAERSSRGRHTTNEGSYLRNLGNCHSTFLTYTLIPLCW
jgi:hypothetical protein